MAAERLPQVVDYEDLHFEGIPTAERWSSCIDDLPGCAAWGYTREEALKAVQDAAEAYIEDMIDAGEKIPEGIEVVDALAVAVTFHDVIYDRSSKDGKYASENRALS